MLTRTVRKRPIVIEVAWYETGEDLNAVISWLDDHGVEVKYTEAGLSVYNHVDDQWLMVPCGHYVALGVKGEAYPIAPDVLAATYEAEDLAPGNREDQRERAAAEAAASSVFGVALDDLAPELAGAAWTIGRNVLRAVR